MRKTDVTFYQIMSWYAKILEAQQNKKDKKITNLYCIGVI